MIPSGYPGYLSDVSSSIQEQLNTLSLKNSFPMEKRQQPKNFSKKWRQEFIDSSLYWKFIKSNPYCENIDFIQLLPVKFMKSKQNPHNKKAWQGDSVIWNNNNPKTRTHSTTHLDQKNHTRIWCTKSFQYDLSR